MFVGWQLTLLIMNKAVAIEVWTDLYNLLTSDYNRYPLMMKTLSLTVTLHHITCHVVQFECFLAYIEGIILCSLMKLWKHCHNCNASTFYMFTLMIIQVYFEGMIMCSLIKLYTRYFGEPWNWSRSVQCSCNKIKTLNFWHWILSAFFFNLKRLRNKRMSPLVCSYASNHIIPSQWWCRP